MGRKRTKRSRKRSCSPKDSNQPNYRSGFEGMVGKTLEGTGAEHEPMRIPYTIPERLATYLPDFILPDGTIIEAKGRFVAADRKKHILLRDQHPNRRIIIVFMNPMVRLSKVSRTTYGDWCDKHDIEWCRIGDLMSTINNNQLS